MMAYYHVAYVRPPLDKEEFRLAALAHRLALTQSGLAQTDPISSEVAATAIVLVQAGVRNVDILTDTLTWLAVLKTVNPKTDEEG